MSALSPHTFEKAFPSPTKKRGKKCFEPVGADIIRLIKISKLQAADHRAYDGVDAFT